MSLEQQVNQQNNEIKRLHSEITALKAQLIQVANMESELTARFEKTHLIGSDMTLTPGAKAILSEALKNKVLSWMAVLTLVTTLGVGAVAKNVYDNFRSTVDKRIDDTVESKQHEITNPLIDLYSRQMGSFLEEINTARQLLTPTREGLVDAKRESDRVLKEATLALNDVKQSQIEVNRIKQTISDASDINIDDLAPIVAPLVYNQVIENVLGDAVLAINSEQCPDGWIPWHNAQGRFLRGINLSDQLIDPDGKRSVGHLQADAIAYHQHTLGGFKRGDLVANTWGKSGYLIRNKLNNEKADEKEKAKHSETRPKNVAVLFCIKESSSH
ncbi:hypothetical protein L1286_13030 [Pseudoalteromonas sp. SMS1]|uniref:hypothetical protein n=1 Tax=Pseudoalteromonas sp. SMS1 TaxID=2908894 RepID=UPI001F181C2C|nr:hypothetical protein [Pseudoalteromonas sp. SMS1]MCF2858405.1 hypothetical protein [Pseudoalteromonas sp. SMS1]